MAVSIISDHYKTWNSNMTCSLTSKPQLGLGNRSMNIQFLNPQKQIDAKEIATYTKEHLGIRNPTPSHRIRKTSAAICDRRWRPRCRPNRASWWLRRGWLRLARRWRERARDIRFGPGNWWAASRAICACASWTRRRFRRRRSPRRRRIRPWRGATAARRGLSRAFCSPLPFHAHCVLFCVPGCLASSFEQSLHSAFLHCDFIEGDEFVGISHFCPTTFSFFQIAPHN